MTVLKTNYIKTPSFSFVFPYSALRVSLRIAARSQQFQEYYVLIHSCLLPPCVIVLPHYWLPSRINYFNKALEMKNQQVEGVCSFVSWSAWIYLLFRTCCSKTFWPLLNWSGLNRAWSSCTLLCLLGNPLLAVYKVRSTVLVRLCWKTCRRSSLFSSGPIPLDTFIESRSWRHNGMFPCLLKCVHECWVVMMPSAVRPASSVKFMTDRKNGLPAEVIFFLSFCLESGDRGLLLGKDGAPHRPWRSPMHGRT